MHRAVYSPASETGSVSETPDTPPKQETSSIPDTATKAAGSAEQKASAPSEQTEAVVAADKSAADQAANPAEADTAEKQPKDDKPAKPAQSGSAEKPSAEPNKADTDKADKPAADPAAKPAEADTAEKQSKADKPAQSESAEKPSATAEPIKADTDKADKPAADPAAKPAKADTAEKQPKADKPDKPAQSDKPAKPAAKQKPEDKPFATFIQEDFLPTLTKSLTERESAPISLELVEGERPVVGGACWMVQGVLPAERRFWLCFASDAITSGKTIALAESGSDPSLLESFLIDEKRINLALLESRLLQRLNGQKWFGGN